MCHDGDSSDIRAPIFAVGTEWDHVSPWRSVYKIDLLGDSDVTFLLTGGDHNAGIVSEPGHPGRRYRVSFKGASANCAGPDVWLAQNEPRAGSWWPEWVAWLDAQSGASVAPPEIGLRAINACDTQFFAAILPRIDVDQGALCPPAYTETVACGDLDIW